MIVRTVPATAAQRRIWFFGELHPTAPLYHIARAYRIDGPLDVAALTRAVASVGARHDALSTRFQFDNGELLQVIGDGSLTLRVAEGDGSHERDGEALARLIAAEARAPFDLTRDLPCRATLVPAGNAHLLLLTLHHIAADGWSIAILLRELSLAYAAARRRENGLGLPRPLQYADYAEREAAARREGRWRASATYWSTTLRDAPRLTAPVDRPRPPVGSIDGARQPFVLDAALANGIAALARSHGVTTFATLLAAFTVLLHRYTAQTDIVVGSPVANRADAEFESAVGLFANTVALRSRVAPAVPFSTFLRRVHATVLDASTHQELPFDEVLDDLRLERSLSHPPLVQVMFALQSAAAEPLALAGAEVVPLPTHTAAAQLDMTWEVKQTAEGVEGIVDYRTDLFEAATIAGMVRHFTTLLTSIVRDADRPIAHLEMLSAVERADALKPARAIDTGATEPLHHRVERQASQTPDAIAIACGDCQLSYARLVTHARRIASALRAMGAGPDDCIGVCVSRTPEFVIAALAVLQAGSAFVPLDPGYPLERIAFMISDARVRIVVADAAGAAKVDTLAAAVVRVDEATADPAPLSGDGAAAPVDLEALCYVMYTSGSTGEPKGVMITHRNAARLFTATETVFDFAPSDIWSCAHSFSFDFSVWEIWGALLHGARLVMVPADVRESFEAFRELLLDERVTVLSQTPSAFQQLLVADRLANESAALDPRYIIFGGEALPPETPAAWRQRFPRSRTRLVNMYGITETTVHVTARSITEHDGVGARSGIGPPLDDLRLYILDPHGNPAPIGVAGEICVSGPGVARGYLNLPGATAARFVPDPFAEQPGTRIYRSGDLGRRRPDGEVEHLGRIDGQVKIRGHRIEPGELEVAARRHPDVEEAVALARSDRSGHRTLVLYVVRKAQTAVPPASLRDWLAGRLPAHLLPAAVTEIASVPLTANGKVDYAALPEPDGARPQLPTQYVPAHTHIECHLAAIWSGVLDASPIGVDDNFFALGGDSIRALQVLERARRAGIRFTLQQLFLHPTIRELAAHASTIDRSAAAPAIAPFSLIAEIDRSRMPDDAEDAYPLTALQAGMLYHMELAAGSNMYHNTGGVHIELPHPFDRAAFEEAVRRLVARHPAFRTGFDLVAYSEPLQIVHRTAALALEIHDISALDHDEQERVLSDLLESEKARPFDLTRPTLLRFFVHLRSARSFQFTITECHAIFDGWSYHSTVVELFRTYVALRTSRPPDAVPAPEVSFRDYVALEREALASASERSFWERQLAGAPILQLPRWNAIAGSRTPRPPRIARTRIVFPPEVYRGLQQLVASAGVPLKSALLAAHIKVMSALSGSDDVLTGMVTNGRPEAPGADALVGLFLNTVPFRQKVASGSWLDLVAATFASERALIPHRRYPLAQIQRDAARGPLCDEVAFNFMDFHVYDALAPDVDMRVLSEKNSEGTNFNLVAQFQHLTMVSLLARQQVALHLHYDANQFPSEQIAFINECYQSVLRLMTSNPTAAHGFAATVPERERARVLAVNRPGRTLDGACTFHEGFERQAARTPDAIAVVAGDASLTYRTVNERANQLARRLQALGAGRERRVGVSARRDPGTIIAFLAVLKAGAVYVPIDLRYPSPQLVAIVDETDLALCLDLDGSHAESLNALAARGTTVVTLDREAAAVRSLPVDNLDVPVFPEQLAYVIMTSGSSGRPKGVMVEHRSVVNLAAALRTRVDSLRAPAASLGIALNGPFTFDTSIKQLAQLLAGHTLHVLTEACRLDPAALAEYVFTRGLDVLDSTPSHLRAAAEAGMLEAKRTAPLTLLLGGEAIDPDLWRRVALADSIAGWNLYGPTECTVDATVGPVRGDDPTIGDPIDNVRVYVLDAQLNLVGRGTVGELYVAGAGVARGYVAAPAATAAAFLPDPFSVDGGDRMYRTGDRVRWTAGGRLEFVERRDRQVKIRGFRVEPGAVEQALREHPAARRAAVLAPRTPSGDAHLVAFVEPAPSRAATLAGQPRYLLPNGLAIAHVHRHETDFLYAEVFERRAYARHGVGLRDGAVVFDVGGNIGLFSLFAHLTARGVRVYAFEPHPRLCALLRANTAHYGAEVRAFTAALGRTPGQAQFTYYSGLSYLSGLHPDPDKERALVRSHLAASRGRFGGPQAATATDFPDLVERLLDTRLTPETLDAEVRTLSEVIREQQIERIDLLKVNVERSELDVLLGIDEEHWPRIRQVAVEVEDSNGRLAAIRALLMRQGFRITVEEDWSLSAASGIFYVYATRPDADLDDVPAAVTPTTDLTPWQPLDTRGIGRFLEHRLPAHMVPSRIIAVDRLPLSRHGKIDYAALAASLETPAPAPLASDEPMTPVEQAIARVWCETLGIGRVGLDDPFFSVGGDSLQLVRVRARLLDTTGRLVPLVDLLQHRTIRSLANYLAASDRPPADATGQPVAVARARTVERRRRWQGGGEVPPVAPGATE